MSAIIAAARLISYSPSLRDRTWIEGECEELIAAGSWTDLGALLCAIAAAARPVAGGLSAALTTAQAQEPRTADPAWGSAVWVAAELRAHVVEICANDSDLQAEALYAAGVAARITI